MTSPTVRSLSKSREHLAVERALPAQMMLAMNELCTGRGLTVMRPDVVQKLMMAVVAPLTRMNNLSVSRNAGKINDLATTLLNDLSPTIRATVSTAAPCSA